MNEPTISVVTGRPDTLEKDLAEYLHTIPGEVLDWDERIHPHRRTEQICDRLAALDPDRSYVVATCSEHTMFAIRLAVARGIVAAARIKVLVVWPADSHGMQTDEYLLNPDGSWVVPPEDAFDESEQILSELLDIRFASDRIL